jgi:RNA polymerase sigma-70 factor, ECF subfamily
MQRVSTGDDASFQVLVERHQQKLLNFFVRMDVHTDVEDLVQETFVRLYRNRVNYRPRAKFTTYLYTIARSVRIDRIRKDQRKVKLLVAYEEDQQLEASNAPRSDRQIIVREAVQALPDKLRSCLVLSVYQGLKYHEISEVLDIPEGTVKSRMHQAMKELKVKLSP